MIENILSAMMQVNFIYDGVSKFVQFPYKFTGKERDTESGNDYFGARYFGSSMGRFLSPDPSGLSSANLSNPQSLNLYAYVMNNPLNSVDPNGLDDDPCNGTQIAADGSGDGPSPCPGGGIVPPAPNPPDIDPCEGQPDSCGQQQANASVAQSASLLAYVHLLLGGCSQALRVASGDQAGLQRAFSSWSTLQPAASANGIDPNLLAAVGVRESDFIPTRVQSDGPGVGAFQQTVTPGGRVTAAQATKLSWAANHAAGMLGSDISAMASAHPNLNPAQATQAGVDTYNFGFINKKTGQPNISGNPATMDQGTTGNNYGGNVMAIAGSCFGF